MVQGDSGNGTDPPAAGHGDVDGGRRGAGQPRQFSRGVVTKHRLLPHPEYRRPEDGGPTWVAAEGRLHAWVEALPATAAQPALDLLARHPAAEHLRPAY